MAEWDTPAGLVVAGMGGSAIGGALARAALGDHASRPIFVHPRLRPAAMDDARHDCAVRELLGQHRGDARLLRVRRRARRPARGGHHRRAARRDGARRRRARDPAPRRLSAACGRRLHDRRRAGGRGAVRGRPAPDLRDRRRRLSHRAARRRVGPRRARGLAGQGGRPRPARHRAGDRGRRPDHADRLPLEDPDQRERQAAGLLRTSCPSSTTTRSWAGRAPRDVGRFSAVFLDDSDAHPRVKERMDLTERADRRQRRASFRLETRGQTDDRARHLAGAARRPGLDLPGRAARGRPRAGEADRAAQGRADKR